jgi:hypothetical protein
MQGDAGRVGGSKKGGAEARQGKRPEETNDLGLPRHRNRNPSSSH